MPDKSLYKYEIPLSGKLVTRDAPAKIGPNYQQLTNMRYTPNSIKGVGGMTKINSTPISTYTKIRSGIHFRKDQPSESHVVVEAYNSGETDSRILQNTTAIPGTGNFSATSLYNPSYDPSVSGEYAGRFSYAPDGDLAYCDGSESTIWGGTEREIAGAINHDPDGSFSYDFTEELRNSNTSDTAALTSRSSGIDANTMLLLHLDNNVTDSSPTTAHTVTNNNVTFTTDAKAFGTHSAVFTTNAFLTVPDNADFDLGNGAFTLDFWVWLDDLSSDYSLYYQNTTNDDDSFNVLVDTNGAVVVRIKAAAAKQFAGAVDFQTDDGVLYDHQVLGVSVGTLWQHIEITHSANDWYIFVNGQLSAYLSDAAEPADYTGLVQIGYDGTTYLEGKIDEFRVSDAARHTAEFEVESEAYSTDSTQVALYIASVRPLDGFKLYVSTANTAASTMTAFYWDGSYWAAVASLSDGTSASSKSLAQTGTVTFTSTASTAKVKYFGGILAYWYKVVVDASAGSPALYYATVSTPFQDIVDIWDGSPRLIDSFQKFEDSKYHEATINVRENEYDSGNSGSFIELDSLVKTTEYLIRGDVRGYVYVCFWKGKHNSRNSYDRLLLGRDRLGECRLDRRWYDIKQCQHGSNRNCHMDITNN
jgi:hypothetical protein